MSGLRDKPAYPGEQEIQIQDAPNIRYPVPGMTFREAAALHIMAGLMANSDLYAGEKENARAAVKAADALIAALEAPAAVKAE